MMNDIYDITLNEIFNILRDTSFTIEELEERIGNTGGPMRVAPACTVLEYLDELQADGILFFNAETQRFITKDL